MTSDPRTCDPPCKDSGGILNVLFHDVDSDDLESEQVLFVSDKGLAAANPFLEHSKRPVVLAMSCEYTS